MLITIIMEQSLNTVHLTRGRTAEGTRLTMAATRETRQHTEAYLGASPRGSLTLYRAGQARAAILGRDFVLPDDVKALALSALGHRVIPGPSARLRDVSAERIVEEIVGEVPVPGGDLMGEG